MMSKDSKLIMGILRIYLEYVFLRNILATILLVVIMALPYLVIMYYASANVYESTTKPYSSQPYIAPPTLNGGCSVPFGFRGNASTCADVIEYKQKYMKRVK